MRRFAFVLLSFAPAVIAGQIGVVQTNLGTYRDSPSSPTLTWSMRGAWETVAAPRSGLEPTEPENLFFMTEPV